MWRHETIHLIRRARHIERAIRFPVATSIMLSSVYARMRQLTHEMMSRLSNAVNDMTVLS